MFTGMRNGERGDSVRPFEALRATQRGYHPPIGLIYFAARQKRR